MASLHPPGAEPSTSRRRAEILPAILALLVLAWGAFRIADTWTELSPTADEPTHLGTGMQLVDRGIYTYERLHPPLARAMIALGPFLDGRRATGAADPITEGRRLLYDGDGDGADRRRTLALARAGILPFFLVGGIGVFWLARRLHDPPTALVAVALYAHLPPILAHAGLATTDMAGAATFLVAIGAFVAWLERPTLGRAAVLGLAGGLAVATKYSALPFLPVAGLAILAWRGLARPRDVSLPPWRRLTLEAALAAGVAAFVLWATHGFGVESLVGERERPYRNVDAIVGDAGIIHDVIYRVIEAPVVPVAVRSVRDGLVATLHKNRQGHTGFFLGEMGGDGWVLFFPVAIAVKTPIPFLVLVGLGAWLVLRGSWQRDRRQDWRLAVPIVAAVAVLAVILPSRINIGLRHALAIYPFLSISAAHAVLWLWRRGRGLWRNSRATRALAVLLVGWQVVTVTIAHPDYLPYFNPLASSAPERVLNDSDLDWGQDLDRLAAELERREVDHVWLAYFGSADPSRHGLPDFDVLPMGRPVEGWVAISLFQARGLYLRDGPAGPYAWLAAHEPVTRVGASIDLYFLPESSRPREVGYRAHPLSRASQERTMSHPFVSRVGGVLSADIAVPEHEREVRFYSRVLSTGETPLWREDLMNHLGMPVIGLGPRSEEYADLPLQWMPHIQVADVAASVERALDLGGSELLHAKGDDGKSQWAALLDPNGAAFGIIPVVSPEEIRPADDAASRDGDAPVGCIAWLDLTVSDASATREFYREVVGWSVEDVEMKDASERYHDYNMVGGDGNPVAGVCHARGANLGLPPVWMLYLPVGDLDESLRRVREEGGEIVKETRGADGGYTYVVVRDPVGACLALAPG